MDGREMEPREAARERLIDRMVAAGAPNRTLAARHVDEIVGHGEARAWTDADGVLHLGMSAIPDGPMHPDFFS